MLYCVVLYCDMLYCDMLCCAVLWSAAVQSCHTESCSSDMIFRTLLICYTGLWCGACLPACLQGKVAELEQQLATLEGGAEQDQDQDQASLVWVYPLRLRSVHVCLPTVCRLFASIFVCALLCVLSGVY